ncbi:MAG TPA: histidine kinase [Longimicrobiaceae bacterium]|nr:histidine kinase [Longimicrobiaceae bacterium]
MKDTTGTTPRPAARGPSLFWTLQVGGWAAFAAAMSVGRIGEFTFPLIVVFEWAFAALGLVTTLGLGAVYARVQVAGAPLARIVGTSVLGSYLGSLFWTAAFHTYLGVLASDLLAAWTGERVQLVGSEPLLDNTVYNAAVLLAWSALYFGVRYYGALQAERERALRAEALAHQARLQMLAYQLNPHFLFNALNSLRALIDEDRDRARRMVTELAGFLRYALLERPLQVARLADELEAVEGYLRIERIRFEDRLEVATEVEPEAARCAVPAFLLHPLVENALKHGVPAAPGTPLRVRICGTVADGRLRLSVENTGTLRPREGTGIPLPPAGGAGEASAGLGLRNVRERLRQLFPDRHRMEVAEEDGRVRVRVEIPALAWEDAVRAGIEPAARPEGASDTGERWASATR